MSERMRIAIVAHNYPPHPGGLEVIVEELARGLAGGHDVAVITSSWGDAAGLRTEQGVRVYRLPAIHFAERRGVPYPLPYGRLLRGARSEIRAADVLNVHGALYAHTAWAVRQARARGIPHVLTEHVGEVPYESRVLGTVQRAAWSALGNRIVRTADAVTVYNARVHDWLHTKFPGARIEFIANGVDRARFRPRPPGERRALRERFGLPLQERLVLFVGRDVAKKNLREVLAMPRTGFHLVVCGAQRDLSGPGLSDLGVIPHAAMPDLYGAVDAMVHASIGEGFPVAVQEAMASAVPLVLLWDDGYARSIDRTVVEAVDRLDQLAGAVRRVATDPGRASSLAARAEEWARAHWNWNVTTDAYARLFAEVIRVNRSAPGPIPEGRMT